METTRYTTSFTVADPRDDAVAVLAWIFIIILGLCCLLFCRSRVCMIIAHRVIGFWTENLSMYEQLAALMIVSAGLAIISGSGGAAVPAAAAALILAFVHGCGLLLFVSVSLR